MKAKELKLLRKTIEKADRLENPLTQLCGREYGNYSLLKSKDNADDAFHLVLPKNVSTGEAQESNLANCDSKNNSNVVTDNKELQQQQLEMSSALTIRSFKTWQAIKPSHLFHDMLDLFQENMATLYEQSSWGLNLEEKKEELQHRKARFLILTTTSTTPPLSSTETHDNDRETCASSSSSPSLSSSSLAAFCHYRFEYDDDQYPTCAALYLYEIQVSKTFQSLGIGKCLMELLRGMAQQASMFKILLTVFHSNQQAMKFYQRLGYLVDESSPSHDDKQENGEKVDYEILSKKV
ncbi:hypothetical protein ACA910_022246 [Epithemia clementina (nom. ined.)]